MAHSAEEARQHLTEAESDALGPFVWGAWVGVAEGKQEQYVWDLRALIEQIKTDAHAAGAAEALAKKCPGPHLVPAKPDPSEEW